MEGGGDFVCDGGIGDGGDVWDVEGGFEDFGGGEGALGEDEVDVGGGGVEIKTQRADGLRDCRKLLLLAKAGKLDGYLLEGMACPGDSDI